MRRARFAILALLLLLGGSLACLLLLDEEGPAPEEELPRAGVELAGPARAGVAAEAATKRAAESSAASSAASSSTPMAPRALVPSPSAPSGPTPPGAQEESEFVGEVQLSIYAGEQLFLEPADVQLEATFGGQPCRVELAQAPERALQAHLEVRWSGAARSPRLVVRAWLRQDPRRRDVFVTSLVENHRIDSLLDLQLRHELTVRCDRPLTEGEVQAHLLDHRGESRRSWDVELGEGGPSSVATFSGLPPGDYRLLALGQGSEGGRRVGQGRVRLAKGRPGLVDLSLEASAVLEVQVLGPKGQPVGANLRIDGEPFLSERDPERWAERTFAEEDEYERRPAPLQESRYLPPGETQRYTLPPGRWDLRAASANPAWAGAAAAVELAPGQKQRLLLRLQQEVPTPVRLSEDLSVSSELQLDAPAGASLVYRSARELLVRGLPPGAPARLLILRRAEDRVTLGQAELHGGQPAQLTFVAPARAAITLFEPSGELAERLEGVDLVPTRPALPATFRLKATPDDLLGHPNGWGGHAWVEEQPRELDDLAGRAMSEPDEAGRWCVERLFPGRYRVELMGWPDADFEVQLAAGQLYEVRRPLPPARD